MRRIRTLGSIAAILLCLALAVAVSNPASSQDNYKLRIADLETRVTLLEATVAAIQGEAPTIASTTHTLTGTFTGTAATISGTSCTVWTPDNSQTIFVHDANDTLIASGEIRPGVRVGDSECAAPFTVESVAESPAYIIYTGRVIFTHAFNVTLQQIEAANWNIEIESRYRD
jgi:hypothetical protein